MTGRLGLFDREWEGWECLAVALRCDQCINSLHAGWLQLRSPCQKQGEAQAVLCSHWVIFLFQSLLNITNGSMNFSDIPELMGPPVCICGCAWVRLLSRSPLGSVGLGWNPFSCWSSQSQKEESFNIDTYLIGSQKKEANSCCSINSHGIWWVWGGRTVLAIGALRSSLVSAGHSESLVLFRTLG